MTNPPAKEPPSRQATVSQVVRFIMMVLVLCAVLFIAAGTLKWPMGWAYVALTGASTLASRLLMFKFQPDLIAERARSLNAPDAKSWDKPLVQFVAVLGPLLMLVVCGLDLRFGWQPEVPLWLQLAAFTLVALGVTISIWAMLTNPFFSGVVRIQTDRGHRVISGGPYRFIRHPGYLGGVLAGLGGPLALGSLWGLIPGLLVSLVTIVRTALEDRTLRAELPGYAQYAQHTRYRLLPGIW